MVQGSFYFKYFNGDSISDSFTRMLCYILIIQSKVTDVRYQFLSISLISYNVINIDHLVVSKSNMLLGLLYSFS